MRVDSCYVRHSVWVIRKEIHPPPRPPAGDFEPGPGLITQTNLSTKPHRARASWDGGLWTPLKALGGGSSAFNSTLSTYVQIKKAAVGREASAATSDFLVSGSKTVVSPGAIKKH